MTTLDPRIAAVLDQLEQQAQQGPVAAPQLTELDQLEAQLQASRIPQQMAKEVGPLQAATYQFGGNMQNLGLGIENSLLAALNKLMPDFSKISPMGSMVNERISKDIEAETEANRRQYLLNRELLGAIQEERPYSSFAGDALSFVAELVGARMLGGPQFQGSTRGRTLAGRTVQEGAIGTAFGATTVGMTDEEKERMIAHGLLIGSIAPSVFSGIGRAITLDERTIERITEYARIEKLFNATGLLTVGEITGHRGLSKLEAALDNIPFLGLASKRNHQFDRFKEITESIVSWFGPNAKTTDDLVNAVMRNFNRLKAKSDDTYDKLAIRIDKETMGGRLGMTLRRYNGQEGEYIKAARRMLDEELSIDEAFRNEKLIKQLEAIIGDTAKPRRLTFQGARRTLRRIQELAAVEQRGAARGELTRERLRAYRQIEAGLVKDMEAFANYVQNPGAKTSIMQDLRKANEEWRDSVLPFYKAPVVQDIVGNTYNPAMDADGVVSAFLNASKPQRSATMMGLLSPNEQDIARYLAIREAFTRSMAGRPSYFIQPQAFARELEKMSSLFDTSFSASQKEILSGYIQLVEQGHRAFQKSSALGPLVAASGGAMIGANKTGVGIKPYVLGLLGARFYLGTRAGTGLMRQLARAQSSKEIMALTRQAELGLVRWLEANYAELYQNANPDMPKGPYQNMNPFTDPYLQSNPPREDLIRR